MLFTVQNFLKISSHTHYRNTLEVFYFHNMSSKQAQSDNETKF